MSDPTPYAAAPFNHIKADIILRSSDNIDFRVFKLFLSLASPFFETLFDIPQPSEDNDGQEVKDGLPIVPVTEGSKTLEALLRFCYPCTLAEDPKLDELQEAMDVLEAAKKYFLDAIERKAHQAIVNPKILEAEPLRCFAIMHRGRLREETLLAARYTLLQPLIPSWFQEVDLLTATDLLSLLTYHQRCGDAVYSLRLDLSWMRTYYGSSEACSWLSGTNSYSCHCPNSRQPKYEVFTTSLQWWEEFMDELFTALRDKPCKETAKTIAENTVQIIKARECRACSPRIAEGMRDLLDLFSRKIEEAISQIELELNF